MCKANKRPSMLIIDTKTDTGESGLCLQASHVSNAASSPGTCTPQAGAQISNGLGERSA